MRAHRIVAAAVALGSAALVVLAGTSPAGSQPASTPGPSAVTSWNTIAQRTIFTENSTPVPASPVWFAGVSLAVYDAVVAVEGRYESYTDGVDLPTRVAHAASSEVAAATAAYRVLKHDFPASAANLRRDYVAFLDEHDPGQATALGRVVGERAARALIAERRDDGRNASITLSTTPAPGVWRPTPPANAPMVAPWLGFVRPFVVDSASQFALPGSDPITSAGYAADVAEVQAYGAKDGSSRTPEQTATALFFAANPVAQYQAAMREAVAVNGLDIVDSARAFALQNAATADAIITTWREKYERPTWRPITAITLADTDGNDATSPDPSWTPLVATPAYPEYPSGHATVTGATTGTIETVLGGDADITVPSLTSAAARTYSTTSELDVDAMNGRVWLGIHFRTAMADANELGHAVAAYAAQHAFRPIS